MNTGSAAGVRIICDVVPRVSHLRDGMIDIHPASTGVDVQVRRLLIGQ